MQTKDRKENPLLNRVEIEFSWNHEGKATPSRSEILNQVASLEPGANKDLIVIKNVNTRFGVGITTGSAFIYGDEESIKVEPKYVHARFEELRSSNAVESPADEVANEETPAEEESAEEAEEGGDE
jgi:small subunit ribosomal protein S24e